MFPLSTYNLAPFDSTCSREFSWGKFQRRPFDTNSPAVRIACLTEKILRGFGCNLVLCDTVCYNGFPGMLWSWQHARSPSASFACLGLRTLGAPGHCLLGSPATAHGFFWSWARPLPKERTWGAFIKKPSELWGLSWTTCVGMRSVWAPILLAGCTWHGEPGQWNLFTSDLPHFTRWL